MEEETKVDPIYKKGFEHGYWLTRGGAKKEVSDLIYGSRNHEGYSTGLAAGRKEADKEKIRESLKDFNSDKSIDNGPEIG